MVEKANNNFVAPEAIDNEYAQQELELRNLEELLDDDAPSKQQTSSVTCVFGTEETNPEAVQSEASKPAVAAPTPDDDPDERSIFVKNVDFSADEPALTEHFKECGEIVRVTIRKNPHTQQSLG